MSFLKINDPSKRDKLLAEYLKLKNKIQNDFRSERLGEQSMYEDFGKIFTPITEQQQKSSEDIISKLEPLQEAIENSPALQALPWGSQAEALPEPPLPINIGPTIGTYLIQSYVKEYGDKTYGLRNKGIDFFIGNSSVKFEGDNLEIGNRIYKGTPDLLELISMEKTKIKKLQKQTKTTFWKY